MIYISTKLKKIPNACAKCRYSGVHWGCGYESIRYCKITDEEIPMVKTESGNMKYAKPKSCPLIEV